MGKRIAEECVYSEERFEAKTGELQGEGGFGSRGRIAPEGNCPPKGRFRRKLCHTVCQIMQRSSKIRTSGSNIKVTFTGAFSVELWEAHPECSGREENEVQKWSQ